jgi:hypothetical protein
MSIDYSGRIFDSQCFDNSSKTVNCMKALLLLVLVCHGISYAKERTPTLRVLITCDTSISETRDACLADVSRITTACRQVAKLTQMRFRPVVLVGREFTYEKLDLWVDSISKKSNDIAVFYYAGKGFVSGREKFVLPFIPQYYSTSIPLIHVSGDDIVFKISRKNPKLAVLIFDCYNKSISANERVNFDRLNSCQHIYASRCKGIQKLIRNSRGVFIACSDINVGRPSCSTRVKPIGGLFTSQFLHQLCTSNHCRKLSWNVIAQSLKNMSNTIGCQASPFVEYSKRHTHERPSIRKDVIT